MNRYLNKGSVLMLLFAVFIFSSCTVSSQGEIPLNTEQVKNNFVETESGKIHQQIFTFEIDDKFWDNRKIELWVEPYQNGQKLKAGEPVVLNFDKEDRSFFDIIVASEANLINFKDIKAKVGSQNIDLQMVDSNFFVANKGLFWANYTIENGVQLKKGEETTILALRHSPIQSGPLPAFIEDSDEKIITDDFAGFLVKMKIE